MDYEYNFVVIYSRCLIYFIIGRGLVILIVINYSILFVIYNLNINVFFLFVLCWINVFDIVVNVGLLMREMKYIIKIFE